MITKEMLEKEFYDAKEAAIKLGVGVNQISKWATQGRFEGAFKIWQGWLFPKSAVDNFQRKPQGNFTNHKRKSNTKQEVTQWLEAVGYGGNGN